MTATHRQEYRDLEKLGFLCRWALLALAVLFVVAAAWAGMAGTMATPSNSAAPVIMSDAVWRQGAKTPSMRGYFDGLLSRSTTPLFLHQDHFGGLRFTAFSLEHNELIPVIPAPPAGVHKIGIRGLPYGSHAFRQHQAILRIVPNPMTVYLLDARFLAEVVRNDKPSAIDMTRHLNRLGQIVLVFPGQRELLEDMRIELYQFQQEQQDQRDLDIPHVFSFRKGRSDLPGIISLITGKLKRRSKPPPGGHRKPYVITGDVELAISSARENHYTHLVGAENPPANLPQLVRLHATPEKLAEHLSNERPAHLSIP